MFKLNALSAAILASAGTLSISGAYAQEQATIEEEVVVYGIKASLNKASDLKRSADVVQDSIVAEDIGKFPDQNVAESLQRITGVSISRDNGEGARVSVRSFGPNFNIVKLNHRTLATTTGLRSFDFQILPSELIGGADVIKSPSADLRAGSSGAYINVRSARPLDNPGFNAVAAVKANFQDMAEEVNPEVSGLISNTFADDTIGIMVGATFKETDNRIDNYRASIWQQYAGDGFGFPINTAVGEDGQRLTDDDGNPTTDLSGSRGPGRTIWSMVDENRQRTGATAVFQWEPNENFSTTVDVLYAKLERGVLGSGLQVPNQSSGKYTDAVISDSGTLLRATLADTDIEMNLDYADEESSTSAIGWNSVFTQGALTLEFDAAYSKAEADNVFDNTTVPHYTFFDENGDKIPGTTLTVDYTNDVPDLTTTGGLDLTDISKVRAAWQRLAGNEIEDEITELKLDALYEIDAGVMRSVKAGVSYEDRTLGLDAFGTEFDAESGGATWNGAGMWIGDGSTWGNDSTIGELPANVLTLTDDSYMSGTSGDFPRQWITVTSHDEYRAATQAHLEHLVATRPGEAWRAPIVEAGWDTLNHGPANSYLNNEETTEAYAMVNLEGELGDFLWSGNLGVRYVDISNTADSRASVIDLLTLDEAASSPGNPVNAATTSAQDVSVKTSEDHFLPSLNLKLDLGGGHILRTAASKTITRPALNDMAANFTESPGISTATVGIGGGNPFLESYEVTAFDLGYEFYADDDSAYSATFFHKDISNFISTHNTFGPWEGPIEQQLVDAYADLTPPQVVQFNSAQKNNREGGTVQGIELGVRYYLPGVMDGFGVQANYTYSDSKDDGALPNDQPLVPEPGSSLEGFAKNSYNLVGFYEKYGFQARLAFNWRDRFMLSRSGDGIQPEYHEDYGQLDFSTSYEFTEHLTVAFEAINLTDEDRLQYLGQRDRVSLVQKTGRRFQLGLRATF